MSEEYWKAQEQRFLDAARRCFTRLGVANASMEDIRKETGLSAGAMYRYFPTKDALIRAAIGTALVEFEVLVAYVGGLDAATSPAGYLRALLTGLARFRRHAEGVDLFRLAIQGWAHAQSEPETAAVIRDSLARQLTAYAEAAARWTTPGQAQDVARGIAAAVIGYVVQSAFSDTELAPEQFCAGFASLE